MLILAFARLVKEEIVVELVTIKQRLKTIKHKMTTSGSGSGTPTKVRS